MRPLSRPRWNPAWEAARPADALRQALGLYCFACERRLPQHAVAWCLAGQAPVEESFTAADWEGAVPLCDNCAFAALSAPLPVEALALPDRELTFTLAEDSPFRYRPQAPSESDEEPARVLVEATEERSQATIAYFALNDHVPALGRDFPLEPDADLLTRDWVDPRLELRTRAWGIADLAATQIAGAEGFERATVVAVVASLAEDTGFWSVWATVLWERLGDPEVLAQILQPPGGAEAGLEAEGEAPPHRFPATRPDWLPPPGAGER
ncbi:MAG TPA: hypothetical protein VGI73_00500 [Solirubrobacterales bacterium]|jgi:hypothetical protein